MTIFAKLWQLAFMPWLANSTLNLVSFIGICLASYFVGSVVLAICDPDFDERS